MQENPKTAREILENEKLEQWMKRRAMYRKALAENPEAGGLYVDKDGNIGWGTYPNDED